MSVYTPVAREKLEVFLQGYSCGTLMSYQGVSAGIENTNYFVTTTQGEYVLTLFEALTEHELPYFLDLMAFLAEHGIHSAHPLADNHGAYVRMLEGKPTALVQRLRGSSVESPSGAHCLAVGEALAKLHDSGRAFDATRGNDRGPAWWRDMERKLAPCLGAGDIDLLRDEMDFQSKHPFVELPDGVIHADLFRDNILFEGTDITGIIDFYYACNGVFVYDVAVTANDWCNRPDGSLDDERLCALLQGYHRQRPFLDSERQCWPVMLRAAALRFWLSRLHDVYFQRDGELTHTKDPDVFRDILYHRRLHQREICQQWRQALGG